MSHISTVGDGWRRQRKSNPRAWMKKRKANVKANTCVKRTQLSWGGIHFSKNTVRPVQLQNIHKLQNYLTTGPYSMQLTPTTLHNTRTQHFRYRDVSPWTTPKLWEKQAPHSSNHTMSVCLIMCRQRDIHWPFSSHPAVLEVFLISCNAILIFYQ